MAGREVERQGNGREHALMVDDDRHLFGLDAGQQAQWHHGAGTCADKQMFKSGGGCLPARVEFKEHVVLIKLGKNYRNLSLTEGVVKHVVDGLHLYAQPWDGGLPGSIGRWPVAAS